MIVESNSLVTIGLGTQKQLTEVGDTSLKIPNIILPSLELMEPTSVAGLAGDLMTTSFIRSLFQSRNNQAQVSTLFATLSPGLWRLNFDFSIKVTTATVIPFNTKGDTVTLVSPIGGVSSDILTYVMRSTGAFSVVKTIRILLRERAEIYHGVSITGAGDFIDSTLNLCAEKLL